jgi:hypothetical protein
MQPAILIAAIFLTVVSIAHLLRIVFAVEIVINGWSVPYFINGVLAVITAYLATMLWKELR